MMSGPRHPQPFVAEHLRVLGLDFTHYSRSIVMEVMRGLGCVNHNMTFKESEIILEFEHELSSADVILLSHEDDAPVDFDLVGELRRHQNAGLSQLPMILLSSIATRSLIETARDSGIDEVVMRPVSPVQLHRKVQQVIEAPRQFVTSSNYVGPCRRRKPDDHYDGPRRRIDDYVEDQARDISGIAGADELAGAVTELREACSRLSDDRLGLVARVRQTADKTARLARETKDIPLERTATAVKQYLEGVGSQNMLETHVLETGINALTQLAVLPNSYHGARQSVASLMTIAVRKKLLHYEQRRKNVDAGSEEILDKINKASHGEAKDQFVALDEDDTPKARSA